MFAEQLKQDPDREWFNVIIWDEVPVKSGQIPMIDIRTDKIREPYFDKYDLFDGPDILGYVRITPTKK